MEEPTFTQFEASQRAGRDAGKFYRVPSGFSNYDEFETPEEAIAFVLGWTRPKGWRESYLTDAREILFWNGERYETFLSVAAAEALIGAVAIDDDDHDALTAARNFIYRHGTPAAEVDQASVDALDRILSLLPVKEVSV